MVRLTAQELRLSKWAGLQPRLETACWASQLLESDHFRYCRVSAEVQENLRLRVELGLDQDGD